MTILASLFALVGRFFGKLLTTTVGWASVLLFGRVPQRRQVWLAVLTSGSLAWVAALVGVLLPSAGTVLIAALPVPKWIDPDLVRLAMLTVAIVLPAVLGGVTLLVSDPEDRPRGKERALTILRGYPLAPALALTLVILAAAGSVRKISAALHRRTDAHVAMVVRPGRYEALVRQLEEQLGRAELVDRREVGSAILTVPAHVLAAIAGGGIAHLVPDRLAVLRGRNLVIDVYPSDIAMTGGEEVVARARALITREMRSTNAWFTTSEEAQQIEDQLAELAARHADPTSPEVAEVDRRLIHLSLPQDEWEVLYLRRLQLVADAAGNDLGSDGGSGIGDRHAARERGDRDGATGPADEGRPSVATLVGIVTSVLVLVELVLAAILPERRGRRTRRT